MGAVLAGFVFRMGILTAVVVPIRNENWFEVIPFGAILIFFTFSPFDLGNAPYFCNACLSGLKT